MNELIQLNFSFALSFISKNPLCGYFNLPPGRDYDGIIRVLGTLSKGQHKTLDEFYQVWKNSGITAVEFMNKRLYKEFDHKLGLSETVKQMLVVHDPSKAQFYPTK